MTHGQTGAAIRCEWGTGIERLSAAAEATIIVDVLSFSTAVDAAVSAGARVYPFAWRDGRAHEFAAKIDAILAHQRQDAAGGPSLSPPSLCQLAAGSRLVLPSPNGSQLSTRAISPSIFAACLRNYRAVAAAAKSVAETVLVVPAGERWPDGSLRPALEDWLGAGAVISQLSGEKSVEAMAAESMFRNFEGQLPETVRQTSSARELYDMGFRQDVEFAVEIAVSNAVPMMKDGAYDAFMT